MPGAAASHGRSVVVLASAALLLAACAAGAAGLERARAPAYATGEGVAPAPPAGRSGTEVRGGHDGQARHPPPVR